MRLIILRFDKKKNVYSTKLVASNAKKGKRNTEEQKKIFDYLSDEVIEKILDSTNQIKIKIF